MPPRLFLDANVVLDYVLNREDGFTEAAKLVTASKRGMVSLGASTITFPFAYYWLVDRGPLATEVANRILSELTEFVAPIPVTAGTLTQAFANDIDDLEDAVQYACAGAFNADVFLTRDVTGFVEVVIPVMSPSDYFSA